MVKSLVLSLAVLVFTANAVLSLPSFALQKTVAQPVAKSAATAKAKVVSASPKAVEAAVPKASPKSRRDAGAPRLAAAPLESSAGLDPVLPPEQFFGGAAMGYSAAKQIPKTCSKLFCYCGCDVTDGHRNLLDCFTNTHGADCHLCQEEALMALRLRKDGQPLGEIQRQIDLSYGREYRFSDPSPALKRYRATRLYTSKETKPGAGLKTTAADPGCCDSPKQN